MSISAKLFQSKILRWYETHKRNLPWRDSVDPYFIWLSEIILQQTRVDQGLPYYQKFTSNFPTVFAFERAKEDDILKMWEGLGYYSRARNMIKTSKIVVNDFDGIFPDNYDQLILLPGIGPYTAAAISSICHNEIRAVVDGNVIRVLSRIFGISEDPKSGEGRKVFNKLADRLISKDYPGDYNQAVMEYGAMHCKPKNPACTSCIFNNICEAYKYNMQSQWPIRSPKKIRKKRYLHYYVCINQGEILIQKRGKKDIYKHLYQLPLIEAERRPTIKSVQRILKEQGVGNIYEVEKLDVELEQVLTHQEIIARFYIINTDWTWQDLEKGYHRIKVKNLSKYAMPRILRHFLSNFELL